MIDRQVGHMARLLDDLLDISRITRGKIQLHKRRIQLDEVMAQAVESAAPLIEARRQQLAFQAPPSELCVEADWDRLLQILGNLLTNAAKYTDENGQIVLTAVREGAEAVIRVRDSGIGINPDLLPRIFDLFTQADQSLDRSRGGLGIGLTMVRQLVQMHGGQVEARSEGLGKGSEFIVRLPALGDSFLAEPAAGEHPDCALAE
jgi:signal transduction histidine kinase